MPGPTPNPNARRRNARPDWRTLPASGRDGEAPEWPIGRAPSQAALALWTDLWKTPQAEAWESLGWTRVVARYTKLVLLSESSKASAHMLGEVRQLEDRLGLTPMAMKRLQWEIEAAPASDESAGNVHDIRSRVG